jgi:hypothetical protein
MSSIICYRRGDEIWDWSIATVVGNASKPHGLNILYPLSPSAPLMLSQAGRGEGGTNEIHFFGSKAQGLSCLWKSYLTHFPTMSPSQAKAMVTFDKSPDYMRSLLKMAQISSFLPKAKIIMILRNPSARAYSGIP